jgi:hypothetical protein
MTGLGWIETSSSSAKGFWANREQENEIRTRLKKILKRVVMCRTGHFISKKSI